MNLRVDTVPLGPVAVGARTFTRRGERRLVAIVKATCELVSDAPMRLLAPTPLRDSELALRVPRPQIVVVASSHAPRGGGVRVAIARGDAMLLDVRADVPAGLPAGLGPLPPEAPVRRSRLGSVQPGSAQEDAVARAFDVALPDDFDDAWFLTVPPAQQASAPLAGGDLVVLVHLHPAVPTLRTYVPAGQAVALLQTDRGARVPIRLKLDTITVLPEAMRAELLWRGDVRVDDEALRAARLAGAHGRGEGDFPDLASLPATPARGGPVFAGAAAGEAGLDGGTAVIDRPGAPPPRARRGRDATMLLEAPPPAAAAPQPRARAGTMVLEVEASAPGPAIADEVTVEDEAAPSTIVMTSPRGARPAPPAREDAPRSLPFRRPRTSGANEARRGAPLPGAPWSAQQARRAPRARGDASATLVLEVDAPPTQAGAVAAPGASPGVAPPATPSASPAPPEGEATAASPRPSTPPAAEPGAPAVAPPPPAARREDGPWRQDPPDAPAPVPPAPTPRPPRPRVSFSSDLYKKFKK